MGIPIGSHITYICSDVKTLFDKTEKKNWKKKIRKEKGIQIDMLKTWETNREFFKFSARPYDGSYYAFPYTKILFFDASSFSFPHQLHLYSPDIFIVLFSRLIFICFFIFSFSFFISFYFFFTYYYYYFYTIILYFCFSFWFVMSAIVAFMNWILIALSCFVWISFDIDRDPHFLFVDWSIRFRPHWGLSHQHNI